MPTTLWFMRHGEVDPDYVGTFVGRLDVGLSDLGRHQAQAIGEFLAEAGIEHILSSPKQRAMRTAQPLASHLELDLDVRPALAEMDFGEWEGLRWPDIVARDEEFAAEWQQDPTNTPCPGGESAGQFAARIEGAMADVLEEFQDRHIALFGHAGVNRAVMAQIMGIPYMQSFSLSQDYGCVNAAGWDGELAQIALVNMVPGPRSTLQGDGDRVGE